MVVLRAGWGAQLVAINDVWVQFLVAAVIFETAAPHIWDVGRRRFALYVKMALVLAVAVALTIVLDIGVTGLRPGHLDVTALLVRCAGTALVWTVIAILLLRPRRIFTTATG